MDSTVGWEVYMIKTTSGKLYTGITNNMEKRFSNHVSKKGGARFFRFSDPDAIVFREPHPNRSEASKRECAIKKLTRQQKLDLVLNSCEIQEKLTQRRKDAKAQRENKSP